MAEEQTKKSLKNRAFTTKRKRLEQDLEHVTQEMYRKNLELVSTNRTLSLLRAIDTIVLESQASLKQLSQQIADAVTANSNFPHVAIFSKQVNRFDLSLVGRSSGGQESTEIPAETVEAEEPKDLDIAKNVPSVAPVEPPEPVLPPIPSLILDVDSAWLKGSQRELKLSLLSDQPDLHQIGMTATDLKELFEAPLKGLYIVKLHARQLLVGVMVIGYTNAISTLTEDETNLVGRLSDAVGVAIDNRLLFEENQQVLKKLQKTNEKLRALDEAKDEFISMASHQLRTPLTSVKGYVSMVIEGDAGKLNKQQRDLLGQAFASSQSMVYLIADLLNVSRLRTGKFVIENKPTQLADVVQTEMDQLKETARTKGQTLTYTKPKKFPLLLLDETKVRQVIMNFTDNALHYTQNDGHIQVALKDVGNSIEFTVVDDGLGVPKEEQPHLFSKFFRADNAKKARPDGTGLGLFMAKKVIIAQGGAIIFKSEEGKGSTFGFTFPKAKMLAPKK